MKALISKHEKTLIIALSTLLLTLFAYGTPPGDYAFQISESGFFTQLPGDLSIYSNRFISSFLLFGMVPLLFLKLQGKSPETIGISKPQINPFKEKTFILFIPLCLLIGYMSSKDSQLAAYYPYSKTLSHWTISGEWFYFLLHALLYTFLYYLPWEIFFRGFLIFPFLNLIEEKSKNNQSTMLMIASMQVIPSSLIHFGHPIGETIGAIPFGILCGWLVLKYKSIVPGLILHILTGLSLDFFITLQMGGIL